MSVESEAAGTESVESLLAFTVDKRQRNAEAASPELRKEALLSNTVRRAHQMLSLFDPRRLSAEFKGFEHEDELIDVDDDLDDQNLENLSPDEILETTSSKDKMAGLIQEMNQLSSIRSKRKRDLSDLNEEPTAEADELTASSFFVPSPRKKGKTLNPKTPKPEETLGKLSLMDT